MDLIVILKAQHSISTASFGSWHHPRVLNEADFAGRTFRSFSEVNDFAIHKRTKHAHKEQIFIEICLPPARIQISILKTLGLSPTDASDFIRDRPGDRFSLNARDALIHHFGSIQNVLRAEINNVKIYCFGHGQPGQHYFADDTNDRNRVDNEYFVDEIMLLFMLVYKNLPLATDSPPASREIMRRRVTPPNFKITLIHCYGAMRGERIPSNLEYMTLLLKTRGFIGRIKGYFFAMTMERKGTFRIKLFEPDFKRTQTRAFIPCMPSKQQIVVTAEIIDTGEVKYHIKDRLSGLDPFLMEESRYQIFNQKFSELINILLGKLTLTGNSKTLLESQKCLSDMIAQATTLFMLCQAAGKKAETAIQQEIFLKSVEPLLTADPAAKALVTPFVEALLKLVEIESQTPRPGADS